MKTQPSIVVRPRLKSGIVFLCAALLGLSGCASNDAVFVTKTSFSVVDVDTTPAGVSFAHDRTEGYFGPRFDNGQVYPVTGFFSGNGSGLTREVRQVFAGGDAASVVLGAAPSVPIATDCGDQRKKPPLLFTTGTTLGIKLGFAESTILPTSFVFGYRRKEAAWVPVSKTCQPSVLATLDSSVEARGQANDPKLKGRVGQYFATGVAAVLLASDPLIRSTFKREAQKALTSEEQFNSREAEHNQLTLDIVGCAMNVPDEGFDKIVSNADELNILASADDAGQIRAGVNAKEKFARYTRLLRLRNGDAEPRTVSLAMHKTRVCKLAKTS